MDMFLTPRDVAKLLNLTDQTIRRMLRKGFIPAIKIGPRTWRVRRSELEIFLQTSNLKPIEFKLTEKLPE
jgi:excisionase family DNA binding protein